MRLAVVALATVLVSACGTGEPDATDTATTNSTPPTKQAASHFLTQASFGPTDASTGRVVSVGYDAWINEQLAKPQTSHRATWDSADTKYKAANPTVATATIGQDGVINSFWRQALKGDDQLRQRVAFALSQIFVVSMQDSNVGEHARTVASFFDMLGDKGLGNYRDLLEAVALHPAMGMYLSQMRNQKADPKTGRVPDENFAREVMQLFSIGLVQLELDGSAKLVGGKPVDTYTPADIAGLARVFTGWSWACPDAPDNSCFFSGSANGVSDPDRYIKPMVAYPQYHSKDAKTFLGATVPAQEPANARASLKVALDTLFNHPNVGPFIGKQLIQRFVTSNPSPAYVAAVARAFNDNGHGVRGDMKAVIKAVLLSDEAQTVTGTSGKVREPVLRLAAFLRAFDATSDSGDYRVGNTDNAGSQLGQTPMRSPSVFNFYRPGYVPPGTTTAHDGLVSPEMQIEQETTAAGYVNYMRDNILQGVGATNTVINGVTLNRRDLRPNYITEIVLADKPAALVDRMDSKLMSGAMPTALKSEIQTTITKIVIPALNSGATNQTQIDAARRNRVYAAIFLTVISPEYRVQK